MLVGQGDGRRGEGWPIDQDGSQGGPLPSLLTHSLSLRQHVINGEPDDGRGQSDTSIAPPDRSSFSQRSVPASFSSLAHFGHSGDSFVSPSLSITYLSQQWTKSKTGTKKDLSWVSFVIHEYNTHLPSYLWSKESFY